MSYSRTTEHYNLPQYDDNDVLSVLTDLNETFEHLDDVLYEQGENMASIERGNAQIQAEMVEIRQENASIQLQITDMQAIERQHSDRLDGLDVAVSAISGASESGSIPSWRDPTSSDFDEARYRSYIQNYNKATAVDSVYPIGIIVAFANTTDPNVAFASQSSDVTFEPTFVAMDEGRVLVQGTTANVGTNNGVSTNDKSASITVSGNVTLSGNTGGHGLVAGELPAHTHTATLPGYVVNSPSTLAVALFQSGNTGETNSISQTAVSVTGGGNGTNTGTAHTHSISGSYPASLSGTVSYNAESPATYVRYWKRTA